MKYLSWVLAGFLCVSAVFAAEPQNVQSAPGVYGVDKMNIGVTPTDKTFTIRLKANPTTGFMWFLREYDPRLVTPVKHSFEKPDAKLMGAPGYDVWIFAMKPAAFLYPQQTFIRMIYTRPFSSENVTPILFTVNTMTKEEN